MISRREFERNRIEMFVTEVFSAIEAWTDSIKYIGDKAGSPKHRQGLEVILRRGFLMRISKLAPMIGTAFRRLLLARTLVECETWEEVCLSDQIRDLGEYYSSLFEVMGSSLIVSDSPQVIIHTEKDRSDGPLTYVIWWMLDAWPDGQIFIEFVTDEEKARIIFQDPEQVHEQREREEDHANLLLWSCIIEYLTEVEYHGRCIWPEEGEPRGLEIILPLRPPTEEELDAPLPEWMQ